MHSPLAGIDRKTATKASAQDLAAFAHVEKLVAGQMVARAVILGHKLGVFRQLAAGPLAVEALAQALSVRNLRSFRKLIDILVKLELLVQTGALLRNGAIAEAALVPGRPGYYGHFIDFFSRQYIVKSEAKLQRFTREDIPIEEPVDGWDEYMGAMDCMAAISADRIARALPLATARTLLDLGGGTGAYAVAFCDEYPNLTVTIRDLEEVREFALATIARRGHAGRITFDAGSFLDQDYRTSYDAIFISQTIHLFDGAEVLAMMKVAHRFLNSGGALVVRELFIDESSNDPLLGHLIGFQMWIRGAAYGVQQVQEMMKTAGFAEVERRAILDDAAGPQVVGEMLVGRKS